MSEAGESYFADSVYNTVTQNNPAAAIFKDRNPEEYKFCLKFN